MAKRPPVALAECEPIETTTAEARARGECSFVTAKGYTFGITRLGFFTLVLLGYVLLAVAFTIGFIVLVRH